MKVKADEKLFNEWTLLSHRVRDLSVIVQNDMEISGADFNGWYQQVTTMQDELADLKLRTLNYVKAGSE